MELKGKITFLNENNQKLIISDIEKKENLIIKIYDKQNIYTINEREGKINIYDRKYKNNVINNEKIKIQQSSLTYKIVDSIILRKKCDLIQLKPSIELHKILIDVFFK